MYIYDMEQNEIDDNNSFDICDIILYLLATQCLLHAEVRYNKYAHIGCVIMAWYILRTT